MSATARLSGVGTPTFAPSSATPPESHAHFEPVAALEVVMHRRGHVGGKAVGVGEPLVGKLGVEADPVRAPDCHHLAHKVAEEGARLRVRADRADGRAHGGGRAREADQEDELLPDLAADVGG